MIVENYDQFDNFSRSEFACSHCGKCEMHLSIVTLLQTMRNKYGKPIFISSGYRCPNHPVEVMKDKYPGKAPGVHTLGLAADIICHGQTAVFITGMALQLGITRLGVFQKGRVSGRFLHIDIADKHDNRYPSGMWTY